MSLINNINCDMCSGDHTTVRYCIECEINLCEVQYISHNQLNPHHRLLTINRNVQNIFIKKDYVITNFIVPWILNIGSKTPEQAIQYIKYGKTLAPHYYPINKTAITVHGNDIVYLNHMKQLFRKDNINIELSKKVGETVYVPRDCASGLFQIEINDKMGLIARPHGVTLNNNTIIIVDDYMSENNLDTKVMKTMLLTVMAVWKAPKGKYYIKKLDKIYSMKFRESKWLNIFQEIKRWTQNVLSNHKLPKVIINTNLTFGQNIN